MYIIAKLSVRSWRCTLPINSSQNDFTLIGPHAILRRTDDAISPMCILTSCERFIVRFSTYLINMFTTMATGAQKIKWSKTIYRSKFCYHCFELCAIYLHTYMYKKNLSNNKSSWRLIQGWTHMAFAVLSFIPAGTHVIH